MDKLTPENGPAKQPPGAETERLSTMPVAGPARGGPEARQHPAPAEPFGVYVHFPWCLDKCPYCDFLSVPERLENVPSARYADGVLAELAARRPGLGPRRLSSVFFGGGTPSLWEPAELGRVLAAVRKAFAPAPDGVEVTVECNPSSLTAARARALVAVGVNRLSVGVQALDDDRLRFLGRWHDAAQALRSVEGALASGARRVSADLIYGVAEQRPDEAAREAATLADLGLTHLSTYALTIEPRTRFGALAKKGKLPLASDDRVAAACVAVEEALASRGFSAYEISNHARDGHVARHNLGYWRGHDYLGLGCGAWGTLEGSDAARHRYRNRPRPERYLEQSLALPGAGRAGRGAAALRELASEWELLTPEMQLCEAIMLGLRLREGLDAEAAARRSGATLWTEDRRRAVARLVERGQLETSGARWRIPDSARLLADGIICQIS